MPELPEVEILVRHLGPVLRDRVVQAVTVHRPKVVQPQSAAALGAALQGCRFTRVWRRAKYLVFELTDDASRSRSTPTSVTLIGHLGMTGRMYVQARQLPLPKHTAVSLDLGTDVLVYEDTRYFGRLNLDVSALANLGPEPLEAGFTPAQLQVALKTSRQAIKVKLLDQTLIAGVGNIYASEALYRAGINPRRSARRVKPLAVEKLWRCIREVLDEAIVSGSTIPLTLADGARTDGLFYYRTGAGNSAFYEERLLVYDRAGAPCRRCRTPIERFVQAARSTFWCPQCQRD